MSRYLAPASGAILAVVVIVVLVKADAALFEEDAEFSSLYETTLKDAYSRFSASDRKVAAGGPVDDFGGAVAGGQPMQPAQGGGRPTLPQAPKSSVGRNLGFGKGQGLAGARPAAAAGGAAHRHDDGGPHTRRGMQLLGQAQYDQAVAAFRLAMQENPNRPTTQHSIGDALRYQGKHAEAIAAYEAVLKLKPTYYCCYFHIGEIILKQGKVPEAETAFQKGVTGYEAEIAKGGPQASMSSYQLAKFYVDNKRKLSEAVTLAEQIVAQAPNQPVYLHLLARAYEQAGRRQDALRTMDEVLRLSPQNAQVYQAYRNQLAAGAAPK